MKIIFLDIDGVMNSMDEIIKDNAEIPDYKEFPSYIKGELPTVNRLNLLKQLCDETGAYIVLSSSWADNLELYHILMDIFLHYDIPMIDRITDQWCSRDELINTWLKTPGEALRVTDYIILDDENWQYHNFEHLHNRFIKVNSCSGFTKNELEKALVLLG